MFHLPPDDAKSTVQTVSALSKYSLRALLIFIITLIIIITIIWFGYGVKNKIIKVKNQWNEYTTEATLASDALSRIQANFGYGGFIHNFKNYVLRKDPSLLQKINTSLALTQDAIEEYPRQGLHQDEVSYLNILQKTVDEYSAKLKLAERLIQNGKTSNYIDQHVKVDDMPALNAIKQLSAHAIKHNEEYKQATGSSLSKTLGFINWGVLIIPLLLLSASLLVVFLRHITQSNQKLEDTKKYISDLFEAAPDAILIVDLNGRITEVNEQSINLFGWSYVELVGKNVEQLMPQRFRQKHAETRKDSFTEAEDRPVKHDMEFTALTKDEREIPVDINLSYTTLNNKKLAIVSLRDISERKKYEDTLHRNEVMLKRAQQVTQIGSWDWDIKNNTIVWSDEIFRIFGLEPTSKKITYDDFLEHLHPDDKENVVNAINSTIVYNQPYSIEHRIIRPDGNERIVYEQGEVFRSKSGEAVNMVGVLRDITEQKQTEVALRLADNVFRYTVEAIMVTDADEKILRINQAFTKITGYSSDEVIGKTPRQVIKSGRHDEKFYTELWSSLINNGSWIGEIWDKRKDGSEFPARHNMTAVRDDEGKVIQYMSVFLDVTEQKRAQERVEYLAQYDQLTSLPNRALFMDRLQHSIDRANRSNNKVGLMFIDLDGFKNVNDTLGHQAGDELLKHVAHRLLKSVRSEDTVARLGGDEFTLILEELHDADGAVVVANKVLQSVSEVINLSGNEVKVGASIGISLYPDDAKDVENLIKTSDTAMYHSKKEGKNQYQFYSE